MNGFFVGDLLDLKAAQAFPTIQQAYQEKYIDLMVCGDLQDVEIELGLRKKRSTKRPNLLDINTILWRKNGKKKIGRNARCPCGSGKKYKKYCLNR